MPVGFVVLVLSVALLDALVLLAALSVAAGADDLAGER